MKRIVILTLVLLFSLSLVAYADEASEKVEPPEIDSKYAIIYNTQTAKTLYDKKSTSIIYPASLTKIMTGILACEYYETHGNVTVTVSESALDGVQGNKVGLKAGESVQFYDLLVALFVGSGNDAACVIAEKVGGSKENFVAMMNERASFLGAKNTHYSNPSGYHSPYMYTTLYDQALICAYASKSQTLLNVSSLIKYEMPATNLSKKRTFTNSNLLFDPNHWQRYYTENTAGFNVGMTPEAGWCMATAFDNDGQCEIIIVSGGRMDNYDHVYLEDVRSLINYSSSAYQFIKVIDMNDARLEVPVKLSNSKDSLILATEKDLVALLPVDVDIEKDIKTVTTLYKDEFEAEIEEGEVFGKLSVYYEEELIGEVNLVALTGIKRSIWLWMVDRCARFFSNSYVKSILWFLSSLIFLALSFAFIYVCIKKRRHRIMLHRAKLKNAHHARKNLKQE